MVLFPNCKINLGLNIIRKRDDGFHDLETVFLPVTLLDILEVIRKKDPTSEQDIVLYQTGITATPVSGDNSCVKAYHLLKKDFPGLPDIDIHLHKTIPSGAGLGGGSADAAFMLRLLNDKFHLEITGNQLAYYALQLGSDCPFFLFNKPCFATGRGEKTAPVFPDLSGYKILLVNPGIHIPTGWAFQQIIPSQPPKSCKEIIRQPVDTWKEELTNDFERPVFREYPSISDIKTRLYEAGAVFASMSGSGSSVFGLFRSGKIPPLSFPEDYFVKELSCLP